MTSQIRIYTFVLRLGLILYPSVIIMDYFYLPDFFRQAVAIRTGVTVCLLILYFLLFRVNRKYQTLLIVLAALFSSFGVSLICFISGDGFGSPYFVGIAQMIMIITILFNLEPKYIAFIISLMVGQHFLLQLFLPWQYMDLLHNLFTLGIISIVMGLIHYFIYHLVKEIKEIRGIIPICSKCKKIRTDEGIWEQIENYIRDRSDAEFSHGICPDCAEKLYSEFL